MFMDKQWVWWFKRCQNMINSFHFLQSCTNNIQGCAASLGQPLLDGGRLLSTKRGVWSSFMPNQWARLQMQRDYWCLGKCKCVREIVMAVVLLVVQPPLSQVHPSPSIWKSSLESFQNETFLSERFELLHFLFLTHNKKNSSLFSITEKNTSRARPKMSASLYIWP